MFKKFLAIATAVVLGAGLSLVAVAAPASAHKPTISIDCDGITYKFVSYGNNTSNTFTVYVDDMVTPAFTKSFGNNVDPSEKFTWDGTVSHSVKYVINAQHNDHDFTSQVAVTTACEVPDEPVAVDGAPYANAPDCDTDGSLVIVAQTGIEWNYANGAGPGTYDLVASAADGYVLSAPYSKTVTVLPMTGDCPPPPKECLDPDAVSYTYSNTQNLGVVTVHADPNLPNVTALCKPFWVTATSWTFLLGDKAWPQKLDVVQKLPLISSVGTYPYSAPVTCGQGDIYAAWATGLPGDAAPNPPLQLNNPHDPWPEHFLHDMGFTSDDHPTYLQHKPGCNTETPGDPLPTPAQCVEGKAGLGSIWVKIVAGKLEYTIDNDPAFPATPVTHVVVPNNGDGTTPLPPGHYIVTVAPLGNTIIVTGDTVWPYKIEILPPVDCHQTEIEVPASIKTDMQCEALSTIGYYTLPGDDARVEWWVGGVKKTGTQQVFVPGLVTVQARITDAAKALGVVFIGGGVTYDFPHLFVLPVPECDTTLALLTPVATQSNGSCTTAPTYSLSNTTSPHGGVQWKVGDPQTNTTAGVHQATWGSTVKVEATLVNNVYDGFNTYPQKWTLIFPAKPTACGDLSTLALTGATGGFVLWIAGAMLLLGGAGIYFARRRLVTQK